LLDGATENQFFRGESSFSQNAQTLDLKVLPPKEGQREKTLIELGEKAFHLRPGVLVALPVGGGDSLIQECFGFLGAVALGKGLRVHLVARDVIGIRFQ